MNSKKPRKWRSPSKKRNRHGKTKPELDDEKRRKARAAEAES